jgi:hypothetical protein
MSRLGVGPDSPRPPGPGPAAAAATGPARRGLGGPGTLAGPGLSTVEARAGNFKLNCHWQ